MDRLENMFREKSHGLHITPSPNAWNNLEEKLKDQPKHKWFSLKSFVMAASLIGVIAIGSFYFANSKQEAAKSFSYQTSVLNFDGSDMNIVNRITILNEAYINLHKGFSF